jgi:hypothetical protein
MLRRRATRGLGSWFSWCEREGPPAKWTLLQEGGGRKSINRRFGARRHMRPIDRPLQYSSGAPRKYPTLRTRVVNFQSVRSYQLYQFYRGCRGSPYTQNPFYITLLKY